MNALLFGVAPVTLAAVIVAAFLIVSPGQGSAASLGFKAGPAQHAAAHRERHGHPVPVAVCLALGSQEEAPARDEFGLARGQGQPDRDRARRPRPSPRTKVTPHNLGAA